MTKRLIQARGWKPRKNHHFQETEYGTVKMVTNEKIDITRAVAVDGFTATIQNGFIRIESGQVVTENFAILQQKPGRFFLERQAVQFARSLASATGLRVKF